MSAWKYDGPMMVGWYATIHSWDAEEGTFPGANYWDGEKWNERLPIFGWSPHPFDTEAAALAWAYENDPEPSPSNTSSAP